MATFRIRAKWVDGLAQRPPSNQETYLGHGGILSPLAQARRFRSQQAAEQALMQEWNRLRIAGNRSVILSVVPGRRSA